MTLKREVGETTEELPSVRAARRLLHVALAVFALAAFGLAAVLSLAPPQGAKTVPAEIPVAVEAEAKRLAMVLESTVTAVRAQAEAMASGPQIRAGVMTDAATMKDLVGSEVQLPRNLNQTLEIVQFSGGVRNVLLTMPEGSPPIAAGNGTRFAIDGRKQAAVVVAVPIAPYDPASPLTGRIVLSTPLDFAVTLDNLAPFAVRATLSSEGWTYNIANGDAEAGAMIRHPIALPAAWNVPPVLLEVAPRMTSAPATWVGPARLAALGIGLVLVLVLGLGLYRNRAP